MGGRDKKRGSEGDEEEGDNEGVELFGCIYIFDVCDV